MIAIVMYLLISASKQDSCRIKFDNWVAANTGEYSNEYLAELSWHRIYFGCPVDMDSLPFLYDTKKRLDSIKRAEWKRNDTIVDWNTWLLANKDRYKKNEIDKIFSYWQREPKSHGFYRKVEDINDAREQRVGFFTRTNFAELSISMANCDSLEWLFVNPGCQWTMSGDSFSLSYCPSLGLPLKLGVYFDSSKTVRRHSEIKRIGESFIRLLIENDSNSLYHIKNSTPAVGGFSRGRPYSDAALIINYADTTYTVIFDKRNNLMRFDTGNEVIEEHFTDSFYEKLSNLFASSKKQSMIRSKAKLNRTKKRHAIYLPQ